MWAFNSSIVSNVGRSSQYGQKYVFLKLAVTLLFEFMVTVIVRLVLEMSPDHEINDHEEQLVSGDGTAVKVTVAPLG